jgi:hypothetical protein
MSVRLHHLGFIGLFVQAVLMIAIPFREKSAEIFSNHTTCHEYPATFPLVDPQAPSSKRASSHSNLVIKSAASLCFMAARTRCYRER